MIEQIKVKGFRRLDDNLSKLPRTMNRKVWRSSVRAGARLFFKDAKRRAKVLKGKGHVAGKTKKGRKRIKHLHNYMVMFVDKAYGRYGIGYIITNLDRKAHFIEYGTAGHWITRKLKAKDSAALHFPDGGFRRRVWHKGSRPFPFMRPAFDANATRAIELIAKIAEDEVGKLVFKV